MAAVTRHHGPLFTLANFITVGRLILLVPLFLLLRQGHEGNLWALVVMAAALFTDMLDGLIARLLHQESDWGRLLDPIADKVWIGCLALFLALPWREHPLPWAFLLAVLARDLGIVAGGCYAYRRTGVVMTSNWLGKVTMAATALTLIVYTVYWTPTSVPWFRADRLMYLTVVLIVISAVSYAVRLRAVLAAASAQTASRSSSPLRVSS